MPFITLDESTAAAAPTTTLGAPLTSVGETLSSLRTELQAQFSGRTDVTTARYNLWINKAYREVCSMVRLRETMGSVPFSLVASQPFYLIPVQVASALRLALVDTTDYPIEGGRELRQIDYGVWRTLDDITVPASGIDAVPTSWFRWRRMIVVWPTPQTSYTANLDCMIRPDDLVNDTDSPLLPIEFHDSILKRARAIGCYAVRQWTEGAAAQNDFLVTIRPLTNTDAEETVTQVGHLSGARSVRDIYRRTRGY